MIRLFTIVLLLVLVLSISTPAAPRLAPPVLATIYLSPMHYVQCGFLYGQLFFATMSGDEYGGFLATAQLAYSDC